MKEVRSEIKLRTVQKYIDRGLPIIWTMFSSSDYNSFVNKRTIERHRVKDWEAWEGRSKKEARDINLRKDFVSAHACMIIGYNKATEEIAVSDSWGARYAERWVPIDQIEQVSQGSIYLIEF
jgi:hypothetical protein